MDKIEKALWHLGQLHLKGTPSPWAIRFNEPDQFSSPREEIHGIYGPVTGQYDTGGEPAEESDMIRERVVETDSGVYPPRKPDAQLIVEGRNALPLLVEIAQAARAFAKNPDDVMSQATILRALEDLGGVVEVGRKK